jgi:hypothetical protein
MQKGILARIEPGCAQLGQVQGDSANGLDASTTGGGRGLLKTLTLGGGREYAESLPTASVMAACGEKTAGDQLDVMHWDSLTLKDHCLVVLLSLC